MSAGRWRRCEAESLSAPDSIGELVTDHQAFNDSAWEVTQSPGSPDSGWFQAEGVRFWMPGRRMRHAAVFRLRAKFGETDSLDAHSVCRIRVTQFTAQQGEQTVVESLLHPRTSLIPITTPLPCTLTRLRQIRVCSVSRYCYANGFTSLRSDNIEVSDFYADGLINWPFPLQDEVQAIAWIPLPVRAVPLYAD